MKGQERHKPETKSVDSRTRETRPGAPRTRGTRVLVVEDLRVAEKHLRERGYECDRVTHSEALSENHDITEKLCNREYDAL